MTKGKFRLNCESLQREIGNRCCCGRISWLVGVCHIGRRRVICIANRQRKELSPDEIIVNRCKIVPSQDASRDLILPTRVVRQRSARAIPKRELFRHKMWFQGSRHSRSGNSTKSTLNSKRKNQPGAFGSRRWHGRVRQPERAPVPRRAAVGSGRARSERNPALP